MAHCAHGMEDPATHDGALVHDGTLSVQERARAGRQDLRGERLGPLERLLYLGVGVLPRVVRGVGW